MALASVLILGNFTTLIMRRISDKFTIKKKKKLCEIAAGGLLRTTKFIPNKEGRNLQG